MTIVIPMAGSGQRFQDAGYSNPKPAITVDGKRIVKHVIDSFGSDESYIFIANKDQGEHPALLPELHAACSNSQSIIIQSAKRGPVADIIPAFDLIPDDEAVIVAYCDGAIKFNFDHFKQHVADNNLDGCIFTHIGFHPHILGKTTLAYLKEENGRVTEIKEKSFYTDNPQNEHASSGIYYFKSGAMMKRFFYKQIASNVQHAGEFYVTLTYNLLIAEGLRVGFYDTDYVAILGTPEEVRNYEAWLTIIRNTCIKSTQDLVKLYDYWKGYLS